MGSLWSHASSHTNGRWTGRVDCWGRPCTDLSGLSLKQRYHVPTASGPISVVVCGDQDKPALLTYPDVGLNCKNLHPYPNPCSLTLWPSELGFFSSHHGSLLDFMMHHERLLHCWKIVLSDWRFGSQEGLQISSFLFWNVECSLMHELRWCLAHRESSMYSDSHFFCFVSFADVSCFEGLFSYPEASSVLYHNFCIYHVDVLGHEVSILLYLVVVATVRYQILRKGWQCPKNAVTYHDLKVYVTQWQTVCILSWADWFVQEAGRPSTLDVQSCTAVFGARGERTHIAIGML